MLYLAVCLTLAAEAAGFSDRKAFYKARGHVVV